MASLFDLSLEFFALKDLIDNDLEVNEETGEITDNTEILNKLFNDLSLSFEDKLDNSQRYCLTLEGEADILAKEIKRLQGKKQALENRADRLNKMMMNAILSSGQSKVKTSLYSFSIKTSESVEIRDLDEVPREFLRIKKEANKVKLKKVLKELRPGNRYIDKKGNILSVVTIIGDMVNYVIENTSSGIIEQSKDKFFKDNLFLSSDYKIEGVFLTEKQSLGVR